MFFVNDLQGIFHQFPPFTQLCNHQKILIIFKFCQPPVLLPSVPMESISLYNNFAKMCLPSVSSSSA